MLTGVQVRRFCGRCTGWAAGDVVIVLVLLLRRSRRSKVGSDQQWQAWQVHTTGEIGISDYIGDPYLSGSVYLPSLPLLVKTYFGSTTSSQQQYEDDNYISSSPACATPTKPPDLNAGQHCPLCTQSNIVQLDPAYSSGTAIYRGNITKVDRLNSGGTDAISYHHYDVAGNVVRTIDPVGNQTQIDYDSTNNMYAFVARATNALGQSTNLAWDTNIGKPTGITDPNTNATSATYQDPLNPDPLDRLFKVTHPDGGSTSYRYDDPNNKVTTTTAFNSCIGTSTAPIAISDNVHGACAH